MATTELERLNLRDPDRVVGEIANAFKEAGRRDLIAEEAGIIVEARLRATTPAELNNMLTDEECERLSAIVHQTLDGSLAPKNR